MTIPQKLKDITKDLRSQDWMKDLLAKGDVFIVGGTVRDAFMDRKIKDIDCIVEGLDMSAIKSILRIHGRVDEVGEHFAVIKFRPKGHTGEDFDIAIPRIDTKIGKGHKGFTVKTENVSIPDDLQRRDFTINSMAVNIVTDLLFDPFDGFSDIQKGIIRATDQTVFAEDPLRILRGIQFASRFDFNIDHETMVLMQNFASEVKTVAGERVFDELIKVIHKEGNTNMALKLIEETDVDEALFGKKMLTYHAGLEHLDETSFFWTLAVLGDADPSNLVKKKLKGDNRLALNVGTLDHIFTRLIRDIEEEDLKTMLFKAFNKAPDVMEAVILPEDVQNVRLDMRLQRIPMNWEDIQADGDDIMDIGQFKEGPEVGKLKEQLLRDALMNRFNWKDRNDSLEHIEKMIYDN